uniref:Uncharacterized protein n=1 Tax=Romanomermis culicivorax TaxID=13658 RepID=A0A915KQC8_ROMCU
MVAHPIIAVKNVFIQPHMDHIILGTIWACKKLRTPTPCMVSSENNSSSISIEPAIIDPHVEHFPVIIINDSNDIIKYEVDQMDNEVPTTSSAASAMDKVNVVETRAKTRQKLATTPQSDLEVPEIPEEDKIVNPADLPNQDQWPIMQQQIADAQKIDPMLDRTHQKVENRIHEHLSDKAIIDTNLDMYKVPATKLPFSSRATFYMWQEAVKRHMCHIDQEAAGSHCSY